MKSILIFIPIAFLIGCAQLNLPAANPTIIHLALQIEDSTTVAMDTLQIEQQVEPHQLLRESDSNSEVLENKSLKTLTPLQKHQKKSGLKILDKTSTLSVPNRGWIAYSVPESMKVKKSYHVKVRISKKGLQSKAQLILGNSDALDNPNYPSIAVIEDVKVCSQMSAELRGNSECFQITSLSTKTQDIDVEGYTEWDFVVTPKIAGQSQLKLVVQVRNLDKDIIVFSRNIEVDSNVPVVVRGFFEKYWQWLVTTLVIPIFIYFWNRKKKKRG